MYKLNITLNGGIDRRGSELDMLYGLVTEGMEAMYNRLGDTGSYPMGSLEQYLAVEEKVITALSKICDENGF
jgi:hypothetical protein